MSDPKDEEPVWDKIDRVLKSTGKPDLDTIIDDQISDMVQSNSNVDP